ncbi:MAG: TlpA family protein disulfide reductase [Flavobacterium sp.]|nr:MAG: TlpA family protein disulfide reductase [Flavobacterium sp.]
MFLNLNKKFLSLSFCLLLVQLSVNAQILQRSVQKIRSYKNIRYTDIVRTKFHFQDGFSADTLTMHLVPVAKEQIEGGYYHVKGSNRSYAFDGNKLVNLNFTDSTYIVEKASQGGQNTRTLLYWAKNIDKLGHLSPTKIKQLKDTVIMNTSYTNIQVIVSDTMVNNIHQYEATNFIIDKKSNLPIHIIREMKGNADDGSYFQFIETHSYSNYAFDTKTFQDLSIAKIPAYFKLPPKRTPVVFLPNGTPAPSIKAFDLSSKSFDVEKLKGKMVLINFSLIGCPHCVGAAQMLNRLHEKYKDKGLVIINIYPLDQKDAIIKFDKGQNVKTQSYTSERSVQKTYPFDGYPSFYLLDRNGLVAQSYNGFYKDLELAITETIDKL